MTPDRIALADKSIMDRPKMPKNIMEILKVQEPDLKVPFRYIIISRLKRTRLNQDESDPAKTFS